MNEPALLEIEGLNAAYGLAQILFDLSLSVRRGEVGEDAPLLGHVPKPQPGDAVARHSADVMAGKAQGARLRGQQSHDGFEGA